LVDDNNDWVFGGGLQSYAKDLQALMLNLKSRLLSWAGDCFFDMDAGVDWKNLLDYNTRNTLLSAIKAVTFRTPGVLKINSIDITGDTRSVDINLSVDTIYGSNVQNAIKVALGGTA